MSEKITTVDDAVKFFGVQLTRARINLENAVKRNDTRAIANIQRKINIYEFTIKFLRG